MLMNALYGKLHRALAASSTQDVGASFPEYSKSGPQALGSRLRLHGTRHALSGLMSSDWLTGMKDHTFVSEIYAVPSTVGAYCTVRRIQEKTNVERLRRRHAKRHSVSLEEARIRIPDSVEKRTKLPFVMLSSTSTGRKFPLFIEQVQAQSGVTPGTFNSYGLSVSASLPWF